MLYWERLYLRELTAKNNAAIEEMSNTTTTPTRAGPSLGGFTMSQTSAGAAPSASAIDFSQIRSLAANVIQNQDYEDAKRFM